GARIEPFGHVAQFGAMRIRFGGARRIVRLAAGYLGPQLGRRTNLPAQVRAEDAAVAIGSSLVDQARPAPGAPVRELQACALGRPTTRPAPRLAEAAAVATGSPLVDQARPDPGAPVRQLQACPSARGHVFLAVTRYFVLRDDVDGVEAFVTARHRLLEEQRAG